MGSSPAAGHHVLGIPTALPGDAELLFQVACERQMLPSLHQLQSHHTPVTGEGPGP